MVGSFSPQAMLPARQAEGARGFEPRVFQPRSTPSTSPWDPRSLLDVVSLSPEARASASERAPRSEQRFVENAMTTLGLSPRLLSGSQDDRPASSLASPGLGRADEEADDREESPAPATPSFLQKLAQWPSQVPQGPSSGFDAEEQQGSQPAVELRYPDGRSTRVHNDDDGSPSRIVEHRPGGRLSCDWGRQGEIWKDRVSGAEWRGAVDLDPDGTLVQRCEQREREIRPDGSTRSIDHGRGRVEENDARGRLVGLEDGRGGNYRFEHDDQGLRSVDGPGGLRLQRTANTSLSVNSESLTCTRHDDDRTSIHRYHFDDGRHTIVQLRREAQLAS